jgi:DNA-binding MarR family transcriptional regulator
MDNAPDLMECADCLCLASRRAARALSRSFEWKLRPHGIRIGQFSALTALALKGPMTIGALAEFLGVERTTLTRNLTVIEARHWVAIHPGKDARSRIVEATSAGRAAVEAALPAWREAQAAATAAMGAAGVASLQRLAHRPLG